jgi:hypothetical protein
MATSSSDDDEQFSSDEDDHDNVDETPEHDGTNDDEEEGNDNDDDEDDAPSEVQNVGASQGTAGVPAMVDKASRRRRRNRGGKDMTAPNDDILEQAKQARLERTNELANRVTELADSDDEAEDMGVEEGLSEGGESIEERIQYVVASKERAARARQDDGALVFARSALSGGDKIKRVRYIKQATQKFKRPALEFATKSI